MARLELNNSLLTIIDVQGKLAHLVYEKEMLHINLKRLIKCAHILGIPILCAEQNPARLGPTIPEIAGFNTMAKPLKEIIRAIVLAFMRIQKSVCQVLIFKF